MTPVVAIDFAPLAPRTLPWSTVWRAENGDVWAETARDTDGFSVRIRGFADFRITATRIQVSANPAARESTIRHLLLDQVLPLALAAGGTLVLHASAVHRPDFGIIAIAGAAGLGKSTLAAALGREGWDVVSDDGIAVEDVMGAPRGVPAYAGLRVWADTATATGLMTSAVTEVAEYSAKLRVTFAHVGAPAPLHAVLVLEPGDDLRIERFGRRDGAMALIRHAYCAEPESRTALEGQLHACAALASHVRVSRVVVPRDLAQLAHVARVVSAHATFVAGHDSDLA